MPAPKDYIQLMDAFIAHWTATNAGLGGSPIILTGNYTLASLTADRTTMLADVNGVATTQNALAAAAGDRDVKRAPLRERMRQFNQAVPAFFPSPVYVNQVKPLPSPGAAAGKWTLAMDAVADTWSQINAITPVPLGAPIPLLLAGGYLRATFVTDKDALIASFASWNTALRAFDKAVDVREALWALVLPRLRQYLAAVKARFAAGSAEINSLPSLYPNAGHTPTAVTFSAVWDTATSDARAEYLAPTDPTVVRIDLYACIGQDTYTIAGEQWIATHDLTDPRVFHTSDGLVASGSKVLLAAYAYTATGNRKRSKVATVTRP